MPTLKNYTAQARPAPISGGRRASAEDLGGFDASGLARTVGRAANTYITDMEESESRKVLVAQAEIRAKYAKRLDDAAISGEDLGKIREELDNDLSTVSEGLQTRKGADTAALHAANTGAVFDNQASNIAVTRAVTEARTEGAKFLSATGAILTNNPSYLPQAEQDVDAFAATLTRIPAEKRAEIARNLKNNLNVAAAMVNARNDPEATKQAVMGGAYDLDPQQRQQVVREAETAVRARRAEDAYLRADKEYKERELNETAYDENFKAIMGGTASRKAILEDPRLKPQTREHLVTFMETRAKALAGQERKSDPGVVRDLYLRAIAPEGTPGKIYTIDPIFQAVSAGSVNTTDADRLRGIVAGQKDENGRTFGSQLYGRLQVVQSAIRTDPKYIGQSEFQSNVLVMLGARAERAAEEARKAGKPPTSVLDPESKDYFFKPGTLKAVEEDVQNQMRAAMPKSVDLRVNPDAAASVEIGQPFVDPNGVTRVMTKELKAALEKGPAAQPTAGRATDEDFMAWMKATQGVLKPGQTQQQAIAEWKAGR